MADRSALRWLIDGALVAPFVLLIGLLVAGVVRRPSTPTLPQHAEGRLLSYGGVRRVVLFEHDAPRVTVLDAEGRLVGQLDEPLTAGHAAMGPWLARDRVLYLTGDRVRLERDVVVGVVPFGGGSTVGRHYRLPADVALEMAGLHDETIAARPLAQLCGASSILLRTHRGWARLEATPAVRQRRPQAPSPAELVGAPAAGCVPLSPVGHREERPSPTGLFDEVWIEGRPHVLSAPQPQHASLIAPDGRVDRVLEPPKHMLVSGSALRYGRWLLFYGRSCEVGELRLVLSDLRDARRSTNLWWRVVGVEPFDGCTADLAPSAAICGAPDDERLRVDLAGGPRFFALRTGESASPVGGCRPLVALRRDAPYWEGGRTLEADGVRYRLDGWPLSLSASRGGTALWRRAIGAPTTILGRRRAGGELLLVHDLRELWVVDRASGQRRAVLRLPPGPPPTSWRWPSRAQWIGEEGGRAYWLMHGDQRMRLLIFDGSALRSIE
jgi:hypothetical protein